MAHDATGPALWLPYSCMADAMQLYDTGAGWGAPGHDGAGWGYAGHRLTKNKTFSLPDLVDNWLTIFGSKSALMRLYVPISGNTQKCIWRPV